MAIFPIFDWIDGDPVALDIDAPRDEVDDSLPGSFAGVSFDMVPRSLKDLGVLMNGCIGGGSWLGAVERMKSTKSRTGSV